jgi:hypothetical protein
MMAGGRIWDVPEEFWILWWRSRQLRTLIMQADGGPASNGRAAGPGLPAFSRVAGAGPQNRAVSASMPQTCRMRWRLS